MTFERLLAKSKPRDLAPDQPIPDSILLHVHLADVFHAGSQVLDATGDNQLSALGLVAAAYRERLHRVVLLACAVHDLGKANDHFQGMIWGKRNVRENPQGLRHEWATVVMLRTLRDWLLPAVAGSEIDFAIMEWAVAGHHPAQHHASPPKCNPPGSGPEIELFVLPSHFRTALTWLGKTFSLGIPSDVVPVKRNLVGADNVFAEIAIWAKNARRFWDKLGRCDRRLVAAVKNSLIAADVAGSALPSVANDHGRWQQIATTFSNKPKPDDLQFVVDWRLKREKNRGGDGKLRPFQELVANSKSTATYVKAGCGTGKTMAAYQWAARQHPQRRLFFCYPTTGTATEGFKDYLYPAEAEPDADDPDVERIREIGAKLFHSRRDVDFEIILNTGKDLDEGSDPLGAEWDAITRIESLEAWSTPVAACTVDTVLGLVQNNKRGLYAWPALAQSAFVFDEIHAYDERLFGALLRFLRDLPGLPVLLMTASLPEARVDALRETLSKRDIMLEPIAGPAELEELPRYRKAAVLGNDPLELVEATLMADGKVLWVCNTVGRVMKAADRAKEFGPLIYHSRFKYEDRVQRHKDVVEAFDPKKNSEKALAICSQVAEMSLDLSADLLVTDLATVPALIQRLGRLNRRAKSGDPTKPFVIIEPDGHLPYTMADLDSARAWLTRLQPDEISQRHLADAWEQTCDQLPTLVDSAWLDGGPATRVVELREGSPGITVLMEQDVPRLRAQPRDIARLVLPMPPPKRALTWQSWPKNRGLPVAPVGTVSYNEFRGAEWNA